MSPTTIEKSVPTPEAEPLPEVRVGAVGVSYDTEFGMHLLVVTDTLDDDTCSVVELKDGRYGSTGTKDNDSFLAILGHEPVGIAHQISVMSGNTSTDPTLAKQLLEKYQKILDDMDNDEE